MLTAAGITKQELRDKAMSVFLALPTSLGANASAFSQQLGRETAKAKTEKQFAGF